MTPDTESVMADVWSADSYADTAPQYLPMAAQLVESVGIDADDEVLDVGCGTGNVAITAARRGADVAGLDVTPTMLDAARENATVADVDIAFREGTATNLPYEDDAFDVTVSALGHIYGDPPEATASELVRVTRPGGRIGFTSWTPTSLYPVLAGHLVTALPPAARPDFSDPPFMWGDADVAEARLGADVDSLSVRTETLASPALSPEHFWEEQVTGSAVFATLFDHVSGRSDLESELVETIAPYFDPERNVVELEYLLVTATVD